MPASMKVKLPGLIQEKSIMHVGGTRSIPVDVRVVAATNKDLKRLVAEQGFRANLYSRLNVVTLAVPPLADRPGDIPLLVRRFLEKYEGNGAR
jgi:transcriptional regulator with PAS, ATPase and Fis domain